MIILGNKQSINYINLVPSKKTTIYFYCWKPLVDENIYIPYRWTTVSAPTPENLIYGGGECIDEMYENGVMLSSKDNLSISADATTITYDENLGSSDHPNVTSISLTRDDTKDGIFVRATRYDLDPNSVDWSNPPEDYNIFALREQNIYYKCIYPSIVGDGYGEPGTFIDISNNVIVDGNIIEYNGCKYVLYEEFDTFHRKSSLIGDGIL